MVPSFLLPIFSIIFQFKYQVLSQQLLNLPNSEPPWPNIIATCYTALNTTVYAIPGFLHSTSLRLSIPGFLILLFTILQTRIAIWEY